MNGHRSLPRHKVLFGAPLAVLALFAAGCGGSSGGPANDAVSPGTTPAVQAARVGTSDGYLVDGSGRTLYLFEADTTSKSTCSGDCAAVWPPLTTDGAPTADDAAKASLLGTSKRPDGATQVTYAGHPLYFYSGDSAPGDMKGADLDSFGAEWYAVTPAGDALEDDEGHGGDDSKDRSEDNDYSYSY